MLKSVSAINLILEKSRHENNALTKKNGMHIDIKSIFYISENKKKTKEQTWSI